MVTTPCLAGRRHRVSPVAAFRPETPSPVTEKSGSRPPATARESRTRSPSGVSTDGEGVFIRSGGGLTRHWPENLLAAGTGILRVAGMDVPVRARHVADPGEARRVTELVIRKYGPAVKRSPVSGPPTPGEQATFELLPQGEGSDDR